jgi:DNA-binding MarR family transcriptional regulator
MEAATKQRSGSRKHAKPTASDRDLAVRLGAVMLYVLVSEGGAVVRAIDESGLTFTQMKALMTLAGGEDSEPASVKLVAERVGVSLPSASRAIEGLVKRRLATRVEDSEDRRVRRVSLTRSGRELADRILATRISGLERFASTLNAAERRKLDAALEVLLEREEIAELCRTHGRTVNR